MNLQAKTILVEGGVSLKKAGISRSKRMLDITVAVMALLLLSPVFLVIAISVSLSSSGPVLFKQKRSGLYGAPFEIYKFRSMKVHDENGVVTQAKKNDERVTTVGRFIRRTSLDELPQFINVLKGEMSLVGPRPHALSHDKYYGERIESYNCRFFVKPGITGWAQINGSRGETETLKKMEDRIGLDYWYIKNWSLFLDIKIILLTFFVVIKKNGAY